MHVSSLLRKATGLAVGLVAVSGLIGGGASAAASPAGAQQAPATTCRLVWHDKNTVGVSCSTGPFYATAVCKNGIEVSGATAAGGTTSYAYCTSVNSSLRSPVQWGFVILV